MFTTRPEVRPDVVEVLVDDVRVMVPGGASVAVAVLLAGHVAIRETAVSGAPRGPLCHMGSCFDCLIEIDGVGNRQACMATVTPGMRITRQHGARAARP